jgi:membrane protein YqaA with SNARE-associated domain
MNEINDISSPGVKVLGWLRKRIFHLVGLLLVLAITVGIFYLFWQNPSRIRELEGYGYLGAFVISVILNATLILPVSNMAVMMAIGTAVPSPVLVGLVGGFGAAIGELTGYIAGRSGRGLVARSQMYSRVEGWVRRWGWLTIFILSIVPFVFDLVGIAAGALRLPLWKFFVPCWLGRTILYVAMVSAAAYGLKTLIPLFG